MQLRRLQVKVENGSIRVKVLQTEGDNAYVALSLLDGDGTEVWKGEPVWLERGESADAARFDFTLTAEPGEEGQ